MTTRDKPVRTVTKRPATQPKCVAEKKEGAMRRAEEQPPLGAREVAIARQLLPETASDAQTEGMARDIAALRAWERGESSISTCPNTAKANSRHLKAERSSAERKANVFHAAAVELDEEGVIAAGALGWLAEESKQVESVRRAMKEVAEDLLRERGMPLKSVLLWMEKFWRVQVEFFDHVLGLRGNYVDERFVEQVAEMLRRHGVEPKAYKKGGEMRGSLVIACALIRGFSAKQSLRQRWVVNAWERHRKRCMELDATYRKRLRRRRRAPHLGEPGGGSR